MASLLVYAYMAFHVWLLLVFLKVVFWDKVPLFLTPVGISRPEYMWKWGLNALILLAIDAILIIPSANEIGGIDTVTRILGWTVAKVVILVTFLLIPRES
jgi:hypothetical protein